VSKRPPPLPVGFNVDEWKRLVEKMNDDDQVTGYALVVCTKDGNICTAWGSDNIAIAMNISKEAATLAAAASDFSLTFGGATSNVMH
jgi:hypothetical protein